MSNSNLVVFAQNKAEMIESQEKSVMWAENKLMESRMNLEEVDVNLELARKNGWQLRGWQNQKKMAKRRVEYYEKIHQALSQGYVIIPDFPIDIFAIRTAKKIPVAFYEKRTSPFGRGIDRTQTSESLPVGQGEYVDSQPYELTETRRNGETRTYTDWASAFRDVDFPLKTVKPVILEETSKALQLKIFDEIGFSPGRKNFQQANRVV